MSKLVQTLKHSTQNEKLFQLCLGASSKDQSVNQEIIHLVEAGADVNYIHHNGNTPLIALIINNSFPNVQYLLEKGANPNYMNADFNDGCPSTPLRYAVDIQEVSMVALLFKFGADVNLICPISKQRIIEYVLNYFEGEDIADFVIDYAALHPNHETNLQGDETVYNNVL